MKFLMELNLQATRYVHILINVSSIEQKLKKLTSPASYYPTSLLPFAVKPLESYLYSVAVILLFLFFNSLLKKTWKVKVEGKKQNKTCVPITQL